MPGIDSVFEFGNRSVPDALRYFNKIASIYELFQIGLPAPEGLVITNWNAEIEACVFSYLKEKSWDKGLHQKNPQHRPDRLLLRGKADISSWQWGAPPQRAILSVQGIDGVILWSEIDRSINNGWRTGWSSLRVRPESLSSVRIQFHQPRS